MSESFPPHNPEYQEELAPSHEIAGVLSEYGEAFGFDPQTCAEIAALPFDEAFETAYGYLAQAGLDADTVLRQFVEDSADDSQE